MASNIDYDKQLDMIMQLGNEKKKEEESPGYEFKIEKTGWKSLIPQPTHDTKS